MKFRTISTFRHYKPKVGEIFKAKYTYKGAPDIHGTYIVKVEENSGCEMKGYYSCKILKIINNPSNYTESYRESNDSFGSGWWFHPKDFIKKISGLNKYWY